MCMSKKISYCCLLSQYTEKAKIAHMKTVAWECQRTHLDVSG
jgi:hypothetical protein